MKREFTRWMVGEGGWVMHAQRSKARVLPHSSVGILGDLIGMLEKILYLPAGRQGGNFNSPINSLRSEEGF